MTINLESGAAIRVLIADDHVIVRQGLVAIVGAQADMIVVCEAGNGSEAHALYRRHAPDIVLMDLRMPGTDGVEATRLICADDPAARVIVLTTFDGDEDIYRALRAGARAYLLKGVPREELLAAIRTVNAGRRHIPPDVAERLAARPANQELTPRELDVLRLIVSGQSNRLIARSLHLTEGTVKSYVKSILAKLNVEDRTQAATSAIRRGIVHLE